MSAAVSPALTPAPLHDEGTYFWERLISECKEQMSAVNSALLSHGEAEVDCVECRTGEHLQLIRSQYPSTKIEARIGFERWGPIINVSITGHQRPGFGFYPQQFELPLATDCDGTLIAVFDEGKSLRPCDLASYLMQNFRRCFPRITLPCPNLAVN